MGWVCLVAFAIALFACAQDDAHRTVEAAEELPDEAEVRSAGLDAGTADVLADAAACRTETEPNDEVANMVLYGSTCGALREGDVDLFAIHPRRRTRVSFNATGPVELMIGKVGDLAWTLHSGQGFTIAPTDDDEEWFVRVSGGGAQSYMIVVTEIS